MGITTEIKRNEKINKNKKNIKVDHLKHVFATLSHAKLNLLRLKK